MAKTEAITKHFNIGKELTDYAKQATKNGKGLAQAAIEQFREDEKKKLLVRVTSIMQHVRNLYVNKENIEREIKLYEDRLAQVNAGQFTVDSDGTIHLKDGFYF